MLSDQTVDTFTEFVRDVEPRLKRALVAAFGRQIGLEATAEALAFAWERWDTVRATANPAGYLYGVGRNKGRRSIRRRVVFPEVPADHEPWIEPALPKAIESLTEQQRAAVVLIHGYGWTHREVAEMLGVTVPTVQKHAERGMKKLRSRIGAGS